MSSPQPLPLLLNILAWMFGVLVRFFRWLKHILLCGCILDRGKYHCSDHDEQDGTKRVHNIRYLSAFRASVLAEGEDDDQLEPFLRNESGVGRRSDRSETKEDTKSLENGISGFGGVESGSLERRSVAQRRERTNQQSRWVMAHMDPMITSTPHLIQDTSGSTIAEDGVSTHQKLTNFFTRPFRLNNPLKRAKSVSKIDRKESLLLTPDIIKGSEENLFHESDIRPIYGYGSSLSSKGAPISMYEPSHQNDFCNYDRGMAKTSDSFGFSAHQLRPTRSHENLLGNRALTACIDLNSSNMRLQPVHPSVLDVPNCFKVNDDIFSCPTPQMRTRWIESIRRHMNPDRDLKRRTENFLSIWILEAKGIPSKRRYYCELVVDGTTYARTSVKPYTDICFWGESFEFPDVPAVEDIRIELWREADPKKKKDRSAVVGYIQIKVDQLAARYPIEKWYTVGTKSEGSNGSSKSSNIVSKNGSDVAAVRVKARYQTVEILPLKVYEKLLNITKVIYLPLCLSLEPELGVKAKEDLATSLVRILHRQRLAKDFLCDLIMSEVNALDNDHLMFRGNSLATKAMEAYMKLVAADYLQTTLGDFIKQVLDSPQNCEVDPLKLSNANSSTLSRNQHNLTEQVEIAWAKIMNSIPSFPQQLRQVFNNLRKKLEESGRADLADNLISSSIFLRFLCPAILSPSLFNLVSEYPSGQSARNLTLIAKTLQTLANNCKFGGKESYMEFMNDFVVREWISMHEFLMQISKPASDPLGRITATDHDIDLEIDLGKELSLLDSYLQEAWTPKTQQKAHENNKLSELRIILHDISEYRTPEKFNDSSATNNPPSDYENNSITNSTSTKTNTDAVSKLPLTKSNCGVPIVTGSVARNLDTHDDYVVSSAVQSKISSATRPSTAQRSPAVLRINPINAATDHRRFGSGPEVYNSVEKKQSVDYTSRTNTAAICLQSNGYFSPKPKTREEREFIHIYDDTPQEMVNLNNNRTLAAIHLYDEVPTPMPSINGSSALSRFPNAKFLSVGARSPPMSFSSSNTTNSTMTTKEETDSDGEELRTKNIRHPRKPKKRTSGNFAASNDSTTSSTGRTTTGPTLPSSGYQSQNHSSASSSASTSPIDNSSCIIISPVPTIHNTGKDILRVSRPAIAIANPLCMPNKGPGSSPTPMRIIAPNSTPILNGYSAGLQNEANSRTSDVWRQDPSIADGPNVAPRTNPHLPHYYTRNTPMSVGGRPVTAMIAVQPTTKASASLKPSVSTDACYSGHGTTFSVNTPPNRPRSCTAPIVMPTGNGCALDSVNENGKDIVHSQMEMIKRLMRENAELKKALKVSRTTSSDDTSTKQGLTDSTGSFESLNSLRVDHASNVSSGIAQYK
ncbi:GTPase-activator protein for ras-like GTPase domain-containing protein [Ditylenchus destructor]|nr:GTPase-activator protein for ras-like GTPase domain-containing protein [Ditylenchus destructor]